MSKTQNSLPWLYFLVAFLVFMVVIGLAIRYQDPLKEAVLVPLLYIVWVVDLILKSFDQRCIWSLALVIALVLSLVFSRRTQEFSEDYRRSVSQRFLDSGRIRFWRRQIRIGSSALYTSGFHRSELRRLVIETLAYREGLSDEEIKEQLYAGEIDLPSEIRYILGLDDSQDSPDKPLNFWKRIVRWFDEIIGRIVTPNFMPNPRLERVAEYLENLMEVDNDTGNR
jgi:hypothetical protein